MRYAINLRLFTLFQATTWEGFSNAVWYLYLYQHKGLSLPEMAVLVLLGDGVIVLAEVPTGWLADKLGRRLSMIAGVIAQIASMLLFIAGGAFWVYWLAMAVCGLGDTLRGGADRALLYDSCLAAGQREKYRPLLGHALMVATFTFVAAQLLGGVIATRVSWHLPFILDALIGLVGLYAAWRMIEPPRMDDEEPSEPATLGLSPDAVANRIAPSDLREDGRDVEAAPTSPRKSWTRLLPLFALASLLYIPQELSHLHLPAELEGSIQLTPELLAVMYAVFELLAGLGSRLGGSAKLTTRRMAGAVMGCALLLFVFGLRAVTGIGVYLLARAMLDFLTHLVEPMLSEEVNRRTTGAVRATTLSWLNAIGRALPLILLPLSATVVAHGGYPTMYVWAGGGTLILMLLATYFACWLRPSLRKAR